jgi:plasmid stabilization system protein ParE
MTVRFSALARQELEDAKTYYALLQDNLDQLFEKDLREKIDIIKEFPLLYPRVSDSLHRVVMYRFPYNIFYYIKDKTITVVSIAHQHRKPFYTA